jgi:hypothetical protein
MVIDLIVQYVAKRPLVFERTSPLRRLSFCLALGLGGCSATPVHGPASPQALAPHTTAYPSVDATLGEHLYPNEESSAEQISLSIERSIRQQYTSGNARRDAHPKAHGCVKAEVHIADDLPSALAKGMFIPGRTYQSWIRFSNGSGDPTRADMKGDARGMAIKILGVPGKKLLEDDLDATTQDFVMINHPVFFATDPARYLSFMQDVNSGPLYRKLLIPYDLGAWGTLIALETRSSKISNPVQTRYWSMVPYQLGTDSDRKAVKYSARPCSATVDPIPKQPSHDFLRDALRNTLQAGDACMEFLVQPRISDSMDVEDSRTEWKESQAPFFTVATIRIPKQIFDTVEQNAFCENLSFAPWHALPEHKPLGVTNRLRKIIYQHISRLRHQMNGTTPQEPR